MQTRPPTLAQLLDQLLQSGKDAVRAAYRTPLLVGPPAGTESADWSFRTGSMRAVRAPGSDTVALLEEGFVVHQVRKRLDGPFKDTVLLGRAQTNDLVIPEESVSKLHARLKPTGDATFTLFDAGSSNGTFIGLRRLEPDRGEEVGPGATITFGSCGYHVFGPEGLLDVLERLAVV